MYKPKIKKLPFHIGFKTEPLKILKAEAVTRDVSIKNLHVYFLVLTFLVCEFVVSPTHDYAIFSSNG